MATHIVPSCLGAMCIATGGFVGGLTWSARELGASDHRTIGAGCCAGLGMLGLACLVIAGAVA